VQVQPPAAVSSEGVLPEGGGGTWHQLYYVADPVQVVFGTGGSIAIAIPD
jgi:hypothetical protein